MEEAQSAFCVEEDIQSAMTLLPSSCAFNTEKLVRKWRNDVLFVQYGDFHSCKRDHVWLDEVEENQEKMILEWRGTGPLSFQDRDVADQRLGYKGKGAAEKTWQYVWVWSHVISPEWQLGHRDFWMKSRSGSACSEQSSEV